MTQPPHQFVSRGGVKLQHALSTFQIDCSGKVCADLGCSTGGFVDCLLQNGAARVYAVDTGYGVLDYKLRKDPRVVVRERTNAMHVQLPELVQIVTIDAAWTRQRHILPAALRLLAPGGFIITLIKPHYEANPSQLRGGVLPEELLDSVVDAVKTEVANLALHWENHTHSPIKGSGGNAEVLALLKPVS